MEKDDYVLGTDVEELARLGLQHRVWRPTVLECWRRTGLTCGSTVIDVGSGPGFATIDLAEIVGSEGEVHAVERSEKFIESLRATSHARALSNIRLHQLDLVEDELPVKEADFSWCRWVLCFVSDPDRVVARVAGALRRGGHAIFHEYIDYSTWRFLPPRPTHDQFVRSVMKSWRDSGGEPDIGQQLPELLTRNGFTNISLRLHGFVVNPRDYMWQWPTSFLRSGANRLVELGYLDAAFTEQLMKEFAQAEKETGTQMMMPLVVECVAERA